MKTRIRTIALAAALGILAGPAAAACYADYRAQKTNPLDLHYGVIQVPDDACSTGARHPFRGAHRIRWLAAVAGDLGLRRQRSGRQEVRCRSLLPPLLKHGSPLRA
jgi:hypothetical protein